MSLAILQSKVGVTPDGIFGPNTFRAARDYFGLTDGVVEIYQPSAANAQVMQFGNINAAVLAPVGGLPNTTQSYKATIIGMVIAGGSPSGTVKVQLASETAGTTVTVKAGSYLKYRTI